MEPGLAGSRGVADLSPATRDPGRNKRPAPRDPERPGPGLGLARYTTRDRPDARKPNPTRPSVAARDAAPAARFPIQPTLRLKSLTRRPAWRSGLPLLPALLSYMLPALLSIRLSYPPARGRRVQVDAALARSVHCASFIIPSEHLQLVITSRCCCCLPIGINIHQLLSRCGSKPVAHFRVNVPMGRPVPFTG